MSKKEYIEVQKGPINPDPMTMPQMTRVEKVREDVAHNTLRRGGQHCKLYEPKR